MQFQFRLIKLVSAPGIPRTGGRRAKTERIQAKGRGDGELKKSKADKAPVGKFLVFFFLFVVVGSAFLQILRVVFNMDDDETVPPTQDP